MSAGAIAGSAAGMSSSLAAGRGGNGRRAMRVGIAGTVAGASGIPTRVVVCVDRESPTTQIVSRATSPSSAVASRPTKAFSSTSSRAAQSPST